MDDPTQAPESLPLGSAPEPAPPPDADALSPARVQRGLQYWLLVLLGAALACWLLGHAEGALLVAFAGLYVLAQATDAATAFAGYRDWVHRQLPQRSFVGVLFRLLVRSIVPLLGAGVYLGLATFALADEPGRNEKLAALWCRGAAVVCLLLILRPVADTITRLLFHGGISGRTRRLTARLFVIAMLLPVPAQLLLPDILRTLGQSGQALADPQAVFAQMIGEVVIAFAGVGLFVRRDWRTTLERLGLTAIRPGYLIVAVLGFAAAFGLNAVSERVETHWFPALYALDTEATKMIAAKLSLVGSIVLGISAGTGEELALRGALQPRLGIVLSSLLFASGHVQYSWFGMLTIALLGVLLGIIRKRTNTSTAILVHATYDLVAALGAGH